MAKRGKGKLRTALANHHARMQQKKQEKQRTETLNATSKGKAASMRPKQASGACASKRHVQPFARDDTVLLVGEGR